MHSCAYTHISNPKWIIVFDYGANVIFVSWSAVSKFSSPIASLDTKFETGTKSILLQPFSPIVIAADDNERIRYEALHLL